MSSPHVKVADCSYDFLVRVAQRAGFLVVEGGKHCKVKTGAGRFVTTIPRHKRLKREMARGIVEAMRKFGADITYS